MLGDALIIFCLHRNMPKACPYVLIRKFSPRASQFQIIDNQYSIKIVGGRELSRPYRVWFFAEGERFLSFWRCHRPRKRAALGVWCGWFKPQPEIRHATALTAGAKHWHRQKAVFSVFVSVPPAFIHWTIIDFRYLYVCIKKDCSPKMESNQNCVGS